MEARGRPPPKSHQQPHSGKSQFTCQKDVDALGWCTEEVPEPAVREVARLEGLCFERDWHVTELQAAGAAVAAGATGATGLRERQTPQRRGVEGAAESVVAEGTASDTAAKLAEALEDEAALRRQLPPEGFAEGERQEEEQILQLRAETEAMRHQDSASGLAPSDFVQPGCLGHQGTLHEEGATEKQLAHSFVPQRTQSGGVPGAMPDALHSRGRLVAGTNEVEVALRSRLSEEVERSTPTTWRSAGAAEARRAVSPQETAEQVSTTSARGMVFGCSGLASDAEQPGECEALRRRLAAAESPAPHGLRPVAASEAERRSK